MWIIEKPDKCLLRVHEPTKNNKGLEVLFLASSSAIAVTRSTNERLWSNLE
jgi:hypothetical protein